MYKKIISVLSIFSCALLLAACESTDETAIEIVSDEPIETVIDDNTDPIDDKEIIDETVIEEEVIIDKSVSLVRNYKVGSYFSEEYDDDYKTCINLNIGDDQKIEYLNISRYKKLNLSYDSINNKYYLYVEEDALNKIPATYRYIQDINSDSLSMPKITDVITVNDLDDSDSNNANLISKLEDVTIYLPLSVFYTISPYDSQARFLEKRIIKDNTTYGINASGGLVTNVPYVNLDYTTELLMIQEILNDNLIYDVNESTEITGLYTSGAYNDTSDIIDNNNYLISIYVNEAGYLTDVDLNYVNGGTDNDLSIIENDIVENQSLKILNYKTIDGNVLSYSDVLEKDSDGNYKYIAYLDGSDYSINNYIEEIAKLYNKITVKKLYDGSYSAFSNNAYVSILVENNTITDVMLDGFSLQDNFMITVDGNDYPLYTYTIVDIDDNEKTIYIYKKSSSYYYAYNYFEISKERNDRASLSDTELETLVLATHYSTIRNNDDVSLELDTLREGLIGQKSIYNISLDSRNYEHINIDNYYDLLIQASNKSIKNESYETFTPIVVDSSITLGDGQYYYVENSLAEDKAINYIMLEVKDNTIVYANIDKLIFDNNVLVSYDNENYLVDSNFEISLDGDEYKTYSNEVAYDIISEFFEYNAGNLLLDYDYSELSKDSASLNVSDNLGTYYYSLNYFLEDAVHQQIVTVKDNLLNALDDYFINPDKTKKYLVVNNSSVLVDFNNLLSIDSSHKFELKLDYNKDELDIDELSDNRYIISGSEDYNTYGYCDIAYTLEFEDYEYTGIFKVLVYSVKDYAKLFLQDYDPTIKVYSDYTAGNYIADLYLDDNTYSIFNDVETYVEFPKVDLVSGYYSKYQIMNYDDIKDYMVTPNGDAYLSYKAAQRVKLLPNLTDEVISIEVRLYFDTYKAEEAKYYNNWQIGESYKDYTIELYPETIIQDELESRIDISTPITKIINNNTYELYDISDLKIYGLELNQTGFYYNENNTKVDIQTINQLSEEEFTNALKDILESKIAYNAETFSIELATVSVLSETNDSIHTYMLKMVLNDTRSKFVVDYYYDSNDDGVFDTLVDDADLENIYFGDDKNFDSNIYDLPILDDVSVFTTNGEYDYSKMNLLYNINLNKLEKILYKAPFLIVDNVLHVNPSIYMTYKAIVNISVDSGLNNYYSKDLNIITDNLSVDVLSTRFISEIENPSSEETILYSSLINDDNTISDFGTNTVESYLYPYISVDGYKISFKDDYNRIISSTENLKSVINNQLPSKCTINATYDIEINVYASYSIMDGNGDTTNTKATNKVIFHVIMDTDKVNTI